MNRTAALLILTSSLFTGCATQPPLNTPSGKPEVYIEGKTQAQIIDAVTSFCVTRANAHISEQTASSVVCAKDSHPMMQVLAGANMNHEDKTRFITFRQGKGYNLTVQTWMESRNLAGNVERLDGNLSKPSNLSHGLQRSLEAIKTDLMGK
jgi:hypothetical protein